jgi:hypothetical protein
VVQVLATLLIVRRRLGIWCLRPWLIPIVERAAKEVQADSNIESRHAGYVMGCLSTARKVLTLSKWDDRLTNWKMPPRGIR